MELMNEIKISIRIRHPRFSAQEITAIMKCAPDITHSIGDPRTTLKGQHLEGCYTETYWLKRIATPNLKLLAAIRKAQKIILSAPEATRQITIDGGRVEFFIGWFVDRNSGEMLPHEFLKELADLHIDLSFDVYGAELA